MKTIFFLSMEKSYASEFLFDCCTYLLPSFTKMLKKIHSLKLKFSADFCRSSCHLKVGFHKVIGMNGSKYPVELSSEEILVNFSYSSDGKCYLSIFKNSLHFIGIKFQTHLSQTEVGWSMCRWDFPDRPTWLFSATVQKF